MADRTLTDGAYRALLIPDPRFTSEALDLSASTVTQDGARAGVPEPVRPTRAILEATGEQDAETLTITATRGGFARDRYGAAFTWESTGVTGEIGWETPTAITDIAPVVVNTPTHARYIASSPAVCSLPDGRLITAFNRQDTSSRDKTSTRTRLPDGTWLSPVDVGIGSDTLSLNVNHNRMALYWDDARQEVRLYVLWAENSGSDAARMSLYTSSDGGLTWTRTQEDCLTTPVQLTVGVAGCQFFGVSLAIGVGGQALLLISVERLFIADLMSTVFQYASGDGGFTFDLVENYYPTTANDPLGGVGYTTYALPGGVPGFRVVWASATATDEGTIYTADLGSAYSPWSEASGAAVADLGGAISSITAQLLAPVAVTVAVDPMGTAWVYYASTTVNPQAVGALVIGVDGVGSVILDIQEDDAPPVIANLDNQERFDQLAACFDRGGVVLLARMEDGSSTAYTGALIAFTLGGYTGATRRPLSYAGDLPGGNAPYDIDWFGIANFNQFGLWSVSSTGSPAISLGTDLGMIIDCSGSILDSYEATYTDVSSGNAQTQAQLIGRVVSGWLDWLLNAGSAVEVRLRITSSTIVVRDMNAGVNLQTINLPTPGDHLVRASFSDDGAVVTWRVEVTPWTQGVPVRSWDAYTGTFSPTSATATTCIVSAPQGAVAKLYHVAFATGGSTDGRRLADPILTPRPFSLTPAPVYHGVNVALTAAPVVSGDSWTIAPAYDFGIRRVFQEVEPSPRAKFKTTADAASSVTRLVINLTDDGEPVRLGSPVLGLGLFGANFRTVEVYTGATSSGTWTLVGTADMSCGLSGLAWERTGYTVSAPTSTPDTGPHYIPEGALTGGSFIYKSGEAVRILRNTGGIWQNGSAVKRPRLTLDGPSVDASGTGGVILYPDAVLLLYGLKNLSYLRLVFPVQDTPSGVIELGSLVFGRVEILGKQYGRGRSLEVIPNVDTFTASNGSRRTRTLAPPRRLITVDWQDNAIDTAGVYSSPGSADYVRAAPGLTPAAYVAATADQVEGLLTGLDGAPLVYISKLTPDQPSMIPPSSLLRGRVLGPLTVDAVLGDEEEDEVVRLAGITIEEEL